MPDTVIVKGARIHNLKNLSVEIPRNKIVVFTGVSGSGKSSLVFDTIYTEAQRQLIETFSSFARRRLPKLSRPPVDDICNISTAIVIDQKRLGQTLRSTVGTATEVYTYLRLLYSRCGDKFIGPSYLFSFNHPEGMCPECKGLGQKIQVNIELLLDKEKNLQDGAISHPEYKVNGWNWRELVGCELFDVDKPLIDFSKEELQKLLYAKSIPITKKHGAGIYAKNFEGIVHRLERLHVSKGKHESVAVKKDAYQKYFVYSDCNCCKRTRLNNKARSVKVAGKTIDELAAMELTDLDDFLCGVKGELAIPIIRKAHHTLGHLINIGVGYLSLNRAVATLSGGESQRIKMARQLDCELVNLMYILDEPSIGLHPRDNSKLIEMLRKLRDKGNSIFVVEHDLDIIMSADWVIDIGPHAGTDGGHILYSGQIDGLKMSKGITGKYLNKKEKVSEQRKQWSDFIEISNANIHNLKNITTKIPKGVLTCITGVAGSGKSSLINDFFVKRHPGAVIIDHSPVGRSSRSNPATYTGVFSAIRQEFAKETHTTAALFSFNSSGACQKCKGLGKISIEMSFLDAIEIICDECNGKRYQENVLVLKYKRKSIFDVLNMTIKEAADFFQETEIKKRLHILCDVGLHYLEIGQPLSTLSGGEAQRIKLASELHKKGTVYIMDEPTTGLHMADIDRLLAIIRKLVENNNTVVIIEHNLDIIKHADWIIDLGPEGGAKGGEIIIEGTPEEVARCEKSFTGRYLKHRL